MKKEPYFTLDIDLLNDDNVAVMMLEQDGAQALGIYVMLMMYLRTKDNYVSSCQPLVLEELAFSYDIDLEMMKRVLLDYQLFEVDEESLTFHAPYLDKVMIRQDEIRRINAENGKKGGRPRKHPKTSETPASTGRKPNESQEKREEENKSITTVVNNSSNTVTPMASAAVAADTEMEILSSLHPLLVYPTVHYWQPAAYLSPSHTALTISRGMVALAPRFSPNMPG